MVTGVDIVKEGIRVAAGEELSITQDDVVLRGHAIECRINAEDAAKNFAPAPGRSPGSEVSPMYDPMIGKLIVWDADREQATARMLRALGEYEIEGLKTLLPFHTAILQTDQWAVAETCSDLIEDRAWLKTLAFPKVEKAVDGEQPKTEQERTVEVSGNRFDVKVIGSPSVGGPLAPNRAAAPQAARPVPRRTARTGSVSSSNGHSGDTLTSPLQGTIFRVAVEKRAAVEEGALICVIEAMKMGNEITAHKAGVVVELGAAVGAAVSIGDTLALIVSDDGAFS
ncbi:MAG TPA: biotin/lipoyl-containing protein [Solirubrobacteraceae bacterium]|jgi:acetyl-CoA/propionyl-CoA carboxylase biotin carboxyl carrier protein|nr:biotin/lipoyl-containing protein [Solirubrobacteraceae bacterium]